MTKSFRFALVLSMLGLFLGSAFRAHAQVSTGAIRGEVRDANNIPVTGISLPVAFGTLDGNFTDAVCTDSSNGKYEITSLPLDSYIVEVGGNAFNCGSEYSYAREYWPNASFKNSATPVVLTAANPVWSNINFTLSPGGSISGVVYETDGSILTNGRVSIALNLEDYSDAVEIYTCTNQFTAKFELKHIPLGYNYKVAAIVFPCPNNANGFATISAWPNSPTNSGGTTLALTMSNPELDNIDFTIPRLGETPVGSNVLTFTSNSFITYDSVSSAGTTTVEPIETNPPPTPPNFQTIGDFYDVSTSAAFTSAQVCFNYNDAGMNSTQESAIRLLHKESLVWVNVTDSSYPNISDNVVCGTVTSFSPFVVARPLYNFGGFYQPVDMNGVYNLVKGGSIVPMKFEIFADSIELTDVAEIKSLTYAQTSCNANVITDEIETTATGGTSLRYDATSGQFIYNWKTPKTAGQCYSVTMTTIDSSTLVAYFKLK